MMIFCNTPGSAPPERGCRWYWRSQSGVVFYRCECTMRAICIGGQRYAIGTVMQAARPIALERLRAAPSC